jgi:hypothetical protein
MSKHPKQLAEPSTESNRLTPQEIVDLVGFHAGAVAGDAGRGGLLDAGPLLREQRTSIIGGLMVSF